MFGSAILSLILFVLISSSSASLRKSISRRQSEPQMCYAIEGFDCKCTYFRVTCAINNNFQLPLKISPNEKNKYQSVELVIGAQQSVSVDDRAFDPVKELFKLDGDHFEFRIKFEKFTDLRLTSPGILNRVFPPELSSSARKYLAFEIYSPDVQPVADAHLFQNLHADSLEVYTLYPLHGTFQQLFDGANIKYLRLSGGDVRSDLSQRFTGNIGRLELSKQATSLTAQNFPLYPVHEYIINAFYVSQFNAENPPNYENLGDLRVHSTENVPAGAFRQFPNIHSLSVATEKDIDPNAFDGLNKLEKLTVKDKTLPVDLLNNLSHLKEFETNVDKLDEASQCQLVERVASGQVFVQNIPNSHSCTCVSAYLDTAAGRGSCDAGSCEKSPCLAIKNNFDAQTRAFTAPPHIRRADGSDASRPREPKVYATPYQISDEDQRKFQVVQQSAQQPSQTDESHQRPDGTDHGHWESHNTHHYDVNRHPGSHDTFSNFERKQHEKSESSYDNKGYQTNDHYPSWSVPSNVNYRSDSQNHYGDAESSSHQNPESHHKSSNYGIADRTGYSYSVDVHEGEDDQSDEFEKYPVKEIRLHISAGPIHTDTNDYHREKFENHHRNVDHPRSQDQSEGMQHTDSVDDPHPQTESNIHSTHRENNHDERPEGDHQGESHHGLQSDSRDHSSQIETMPHQEPRDSQGHSQDPSHTVSNQDQESHVENDHNRKSESDHRDESHHGLPSDPHDHSSDLENRNREEHRDSHSDKQSVPHTVSTHDHHEQPEAHHRENELHPSQPESSDVHHTVEEHNQKLEQNNNKHRSEQHNQHWQSESIDSHSDHHTPSESTHTQNDQKSDSHSYSSDSGVYRDDNSDSVHRDENRPSNHSHFSPPIMSGQDHDMDHKPDSYDHHSISENNQDQNLDHDSSHKDINSHDHHSQSSDTSHNNYDAHMDHKPDSHDHHSISENNQDQNLDHDSSHKDINSHDYHSQSSDTSHNNYDAHMDHKPDSHDHHSAAEGNHRDTFNSEHSYNGESHKPTFSLGSDVQGEGFSTTTPSSDYDPQGGQDGSVDESGNAIPSEAHENQHQAPTENESSSSGTDDSNKQQGEQESGADSSKTEEGQSETGGDNASADDSSTPPKKGMSWLPIIIIVAAIVLLLLIGLVILFLRKRKASKGYGPAPTNESGTAASA